MSLHLKPNMLQRIPRASESADVTKYPSAKPAAQLLRNEGSGYYVVRPPAIDDIEEIVADAAYRIAQFAWNHIAKAERFILDEKHHFGMPEVNWRWFRAHVMPPESFAALPLENKMSLLKSLAPTSFSDAETKFSSNFFTRESQLVNLSPSGNDIVEPRIWLSHFFGLFWRRKSSLKPRDPNQEGRFTHSTHAVLVCLILARRGFVLSPPSVIFHVQKNNRAYVHCLLHHLEQLMPALWHDARRAYRSSKVTLNRHAENRLTLRCLELAFCTSAENSEEISHEFAAAFRKPPSYNYYAYSGFLWSWLRDCAIENGGGTRIGEAAVDPFIERISEFESTLPKWHARFQEFRKSIVVKKARAKAEEFMPLLRWALARELHDPCSVRRIHIRNDDAPIEDSFHRWIGRMDLASKVKNSRLHAAHWFFDSLSLSEPGFENPILPRLDVFRRTLHDRPANGKTPRQRIPGFLLEELRDFLVEPWEGGFRWGAWVTEHEVIRHQNELTFCPIRPAALCLLSMWPIRINQVLWLDSGEFDEKCYDFQTQSFKPNPRGIKGRALGVLQPPLDSDALENSHHLDFLVAINKRPIGDPGEYTIPYVDERTVWIIDQLNRWQQKFGRSPELVKEADAPYDNGIAQDDAARALMPELCPLLRDPMHRGLFPPSYGRMKQFWSLVCDAFDQKNLMWVNPATKKIEPRRHFPRLSKTIVGERLALRRRKEGRVPALIRPARPKYLYDLYSLKVASVSYLIDRGIPLALVSAMAGHCTLAMTLRYFVGDRVMWRKKMSDLVRENPDLELHPAEIERRLGDGSSLREWLLGNSESAFTALQHAVANGMNFTISTTGICPGARCEEGLRLKKVKSDGGPRMGVVPGSLCGLCDFRVYGPPFLVGLAKEFNETIYVLTELAAKQRQLRQQMRVSESAGDFERSTLLRNEDEELSRRAEPDSAHAARLFEMINECFAIARKDECHERNLPVLVSPSFRPTVEAVNTFEQWKEILELAELVPASKSLIPDQVSSRFENKLLGLLAKNGAAPFLAVLPADVARKSVLQFARILERAVPLSETRERIFSGEMSLTDLGLETEKLLRETAKQFAEGGGPTSQV